jgi:hypothetical protein
MIKFKPIESLTIIEGDSPSKLEEAYTKQFKELVSARSSHPRLGGVDLKILDRHLVVSDKKYTLAVFYEDYIPVELDDAKKTSPNAEGGMSAVAPAGQRRRHKDNK